MIHDSDELKGAIHKDLFRINVHCSLISDVLSYSNFRCFYLELAIYSGRNDSISSSVSSVSGRSG